MHGILLYYHQVTQVRERRFGRRLEIQDAFADALSEGEFKLVVVQHAAREHFSRVFIRRVRGCTFSREEEERRRVEEHVSPHDRFEEWILRDGFFESKELKEDDHLEEQVAFATQYELIVKKTFVVVF